MTWSGLSAQLEGVRQSVVRIGEAAEEATSRLESARSRVGDLTRAIVDELRGVGGGIDDVISDQERKLNALVDQLRSAIDNSLGTQQIAFNAVTGHLEDVTGQISGASEGLGQAAQDITSAAQGITAAAQGIGAASVGIGAAAEDVIKTATSLGGPVQRAFNEHLLFLIENVRKGVISTQEAMIAAGSGFVVFEGKAQRVDAVLAKLLPTIGQVQSEMRGFLDEIEGHDRELDILIDKLASSSLAVSQNLARIVEGILAGHGSIEDLIKALAEFRGTIAAGSEADIFGQRLADLLRAEQRAGNI